MDIRIIFHRLALLLFFILTGVSLTFSKCPEECSCISTIADCNVASDWERIPSTFPSDIMRLNIECSHDGTLGSVAGINEYVNLTSFAVKRCSLESLGVNEFISSNLLYLTTENNAISRLEGGTFTGLNFLKELRVRNEIINILERNTFHGLSNLESLFLTDNRISLISSNAFIDLNNVRHIYLFRNQITTILPHTFKLSSLTNLDISENKISRIGEGAFEGANHLILLRLSKNKIKTIAEGAMNLPKLRNVFLNDNEFNVLTNASFTSALTNLDLQNNEIQYMSAGFFSYFANIRTMPIGGNPFHCNCKMFWLKGEAGTNTFKSLEHPNVQCITPENKIILAYQDNEFVCMAPTLQLDTTTSKDDLTCIGAGDPAPTVTWQLPTGGNIITNPPENLSVLETHGTLTRDQFTTGFHTCIVNYKLHELKRVLYVHAPTMATLRPTIVNDLSITVPQVQKNCEYSQQELILTGMACGFGTLTLCALFGCACLYHRRRKSSTDDGRSQKKSYTKNQQQKAHNKNAKILDLARRNSETSHINNYSEYPQVSVFNKGMSGSLRGIPNSSMAATGLPLISPDQQNNRPTSTPVFFSGQPGGDKSASTNTIHSTGVPSAIPLTNMKRETSNSTAVVPSNNYNTVRSDVYESLDHYTKEASGETPEYTDLPAPSNNTVHNVVVNFDHETSLRGSTVTYT